VGRRENLLAHVREPQRHVRQLCNLEKCVDQLVRVNSHTINASATKPLNSKVQLPAALPEQNPSRWRVRRR